MRELQSKKIITQTAIKNSKKKALGINSWTKGQTIVSESWGRATGIKDQLNISWEDNFGVETQREDVKDSHGVKEMSYMDERSTKQINFCIIYVYNSSNDHQMILNEYTSIYPGSSSKTCSKTNLTWLPIHAKTSVSILPIPAVRTSLKSHYQNIPHQISPHSHKHTSLR